MSLTSDWRKWGSRFWQLHITGEKPGKDGSRGVLLLYPAFMWRLRTIAHTPRAMSRMLNNWPMSGSRLASNLWHLLGKLDEEAEGEHQRQAETEIEPRAHTVLVLAVDEEDDGEEAGIGDGLIELSRVAWRLVNMGEDEGPGNVRHFADNLRVHEVSQPDEACRDAGDHSHQVQYHRLASCIA